MGPGPVCTAQLVTVKLTGRLWECPQADTNGDADPGVLMSAQTITSETTSTTTTTHITKVRGRGVVWSPFRPQRGFGSVDACVPRHAAVITETCARFPLSRR